MRKSANFCAWLAVVVWLLPGGFTAGRGQVRHVLPDTLGTASVTALRQKTLLEGNTPAWRFDSAAWLRNGAGDMTGVLSRLPGVALRDYGGAGGMKTVSVRGLGAAHTAVTLDGIPVSDVRGGQVDLSRFRTERLSEMSLFVAGASRLLVAPRSLGSATLVLSSRLPDTAAGLHGRIGLSAGSFGTVSPSLAFSGRTGPRTTLGMDADFFFAENDYPYVVRNGKLTTHHRRDGSRMQSWNAGATVRHDTRGGGTWLTQASWRNDHRRLPGQVVLYDAENATERLAEQSAGLQTGWRGRRGPWELMASGKFEWQESRYADVDAQYPGGALRQHYWQREAYAAVGAARHWRYVSAAYAADYSFNDLDSNQPTGNDVSRHVFWQSLSLRAEVRRFSATARLLAYADRNRNGSGGAVAGDARRLAPSLSASWLAFRSGGMQAWRLRVRAFWKELFRAPTFTENYYYHLGSTLLRPEKTRQLGAGLTLSAVPADWWPALTVTADGYLNRVTDRIMSLPYNLYVWRTENIGRVRAAGMDVTLESRFAPAERWQLVLSGSYSLQRSTDRTSETSRSYGLQLPYMPVHSGMAALACENPWLNLSVSITGASSRWSTKEHTPTTMLSGYAEADVSAWRTFRMAGWQWEARAGVVNLFDSRYELVRRYPMPGRAFRLGLTARF